MRYSRFQTREDFHWFDTSNLCELIRKKGIHVIGQIPAHRTGERSDQAIEQFKISEVGFNPDAGVVGY